MSETIVTEYSYNITTGIFERLKQEINLWIYEKATTLLDTIKEVTMSRELIEDNLASIIDAPFIQQLHQYIIMASIVFILFFTSIAIVKEMQSNDPSRKKAITIVVMAISSLILIIGIRDILIFTVKSFSYLASDIMTSTSFNSVEFMSQEQVDNAVKDMLLKYVLTVMFYVITVGGFYIYLFFVASQLVFLYLLGSITSVMIVLLGFERVISIYVEIIKYLITLLMLLIGILIISFITSNLGVGATPFLYVAMVLGVGISLLKLPQTVQTAMRSATPRVNDVFYSARNIINLFKR